MKVNYYPGVVVRYLRPTNTWGPRVSMELPGRGLPRTIISFKPEYSDEVEMAIEVLTRTGFNCLVRTSTDTASVILVEWEVKHAHSLTDIWSKVCQS